MTSNSLRNKELREKERSNKQNERINEERYKRDDKTTRRGQNLRAGADVLHYLGGKRSQDLKAGADAAKLALTAASLNDYEWYATNESIAKDTASLAWGYRTGAYLPIPHDAEDHLPGILTIDLLPSIGVSRTAVDGANTAARQIYSWVRHANSGSSNYEAPDLMHVLVCLGNLYAMYGHATRILGLLQASSHENAYMPKYILSALGIDYDESIKSIASDRARLNALGLQITRAFAAPKDMSYFKRMLFIFSHVFKDMDDGDFGQIYMYRPSGFYTYAETADIAKAGGFNYVDGATMDGVINPNFDCTTLGQVIDIMTGMFNALMSSESANIMSGDIRKAYGENNLWELPMIEPDYIVLPHYDQTVLNQMWNATHTPWPVNSSLDIRQINGNLVFTPEIVVPESEPLSSANYLLAETVTRRITTDIPNPDWRTVLEVTRGIFCLEDVSDNADGQTARYQVTTCGSEIVRRVTVWTLSGSSNTLSYNVLSTACFSVNNLNNARISAALSKMYYHPCLDVGVGNTTENASTAYFAKIWSVDRSTLLAPETLRAMNDSVMINMFYVPNRQ